MLEATGGSDEEIQLPSFLLVQEVYGLLEYVTIIRRALALRVHHDPDAQLHELRGRDAIQEII